MLDRLIYRVRQFWFAITSKMSEEDRRFAYQHLNFKEAALFFSLPEFEQKHGVVVAQKMLKLASSSKNMKIKKLARLGLLHDIGKSAAHLSIFDKSILVVSHKILNPIYEMLANLGKDERSPGFFRKFYVHRHHGEVGAEMLLKIAEEKDIIEEVRSHDYAYPSRDIYMRILNRADSTY